MAKAGESVSDETRAKMSAAHERRWARKRSIYLQVCVLSPHQGKKRKRATKEKMRDAHLGHKHSEETIEKIRASVKAAMARKAKEAQV